jgi:hypothetical protein
MLLRHLPRRRLATALVAIAAAVVTPYAWGASKVRIAAIGDRVPGNGNGQFLGPSLTGAPSAAGSGWVAFRTLVTDGKTAEQIVVARLSGQEERHVVAALGQSAGKRDGKDMGTFKQFLGRPTVNANGDGAFVATLTNSEAIPGGLEYIGQPLPGGVFLWRRSEPAAQALHVIALARDVVPGVGTIDLGIAIDPLQESTSRDLLERTPALTDAGVVAFAATTFDDKNPDAPPGAIFVVKDGAITAPVKLNDVTPYGTLSVIGAPSMNASGLLAFRATTDGSDGSFDGVFTFDGATYTRLAADTLKLVPIDDPDNSQIVFGFGDLVSLNDAGDVAFAAGGMIDINSAGDLQFGTVVVQAGQLPRLVTYPGLNVDSYGKVRSGSLGPEGGNEVALPSIGPDGSVYCLAQLNGSGSHAFFKARPPDYKISIPLVVFGGSKPDPSPIGGVFFSAVSTAAVDATGALAFFSRFAGASELEALVFRPATGDGNLILVGDATPTDGKYGGPPFSAPVINDNDVVVFKSAVARGPSALGFFRWDRSAPENSRLSALVRTGDAAPLGGAQTILDLPGEASINVAGDVAFAGLILDPDNGVFRGILATGAGGMRRVAMPADPLPFVASDAQIESIATNPLMLADGSVAFRATYGYEDPVFFEHVREDGIFRISPAGDVSILVSTLLDAPDGQPFFRFRDPNSTGGTIVVRASLGKPGDELNPNGLFLIDPSAAVRLVIIEHGPVGAHSSLDSFSGRASVDLAGNVAFLARLDGEDTASLVQEMADGGSAIIARVGGPGPNAGIVKSVGRPTVASNGDLAFRLGFDRTTGQTSGFYLKKSGGAVEPFIALGEADSDGVGDRLNSLNPVAALNASDHLAFIASESAGDARNGIFFGAPTTTKVQKITVVAKEKNVKQIPTLLAKVRGQVDLDVGPVGKAIQPNKQAVKVTVSDFWGTVFTASADNGALRQAGRTYTLGRRASGLRALTIKRLKNRGVRVKFASKPFELPFRSGDKLTPPFTVRVDVGVHSGTAILDCKTSEGGNATCPAS